MKKFQIYTQDTKKIKKSYALFQTLNLIFCLFSTLVNLILTIVYAYEEKIIWVVPFVCLALTIFAFFITNNLLQISFGMYYDVRKIRMICDSTNYDDSTDYEDSTDYDD